MILKDAAEMLVNPADGGEHRLKHRGNTNVELPNESPVMERQLVDHLR